ncbi:MAG: late competence development ComFB family protein [Spirochaetota bacterium]
MALADRYNFEDLANGAEGLVLDEMERQLAGRGESDLPEDTVLDIAAYALNHVRPRYRVNLLGRLYTRNVSESDQAEIEAAVSAAIRKVLDEA